MKVIKSEENLLEFDSGIKIVGVGEVDCCAINYLDFEQFLVGQEFPDMTLGQLLDSIKLKKDGFILKSIDDVPKWCQARSNQNGYYSNITRVFIENDKRKVTLADLEGDESDG